MPSALPWGKSIQAVPGWKPPRWGAWKLHFMQWGDPPPTLAHQEEPSDPQGPHSVGLPRTLLVGWWEGEMAIQMGGEQ